MVGLIKLVVVGFTLFLASGVLLSRVQLRREGTSGTELMFGELLELLI
jgi:hypothetical protein